MILATHGFLASSIGQFDADAVAFFDRVTTAGGSLSTTEKTAVNTLVIQMKTDGVWTKMKAIYPMVGANAAACAQNLRSSSFTGSFTSGWTFASTGVTPNGSSAYMDTKVQMQQLSNLTNSLSVYMREDVGSGKYAFIGVSDNLATRYTILGVDLTVAYYNSYNANFLCTANIAKTGFLLGTYISGTEKLFRNGVNQKTQTTTTTASTSTLPYYIGCFNRDGTANQYINKEIAFASIGDGLTDTEASDFYDAVQAFQTTLSRNV